MRLDKGSALEMLATTCPCLVRVVSSARSARQDRHAGHQRVPASRSGSHDGLGPAFALALALAVGSRAEAITVVPLTFEELVAGAAAVVYGRVADVHGQWTADRRSIDSIVTLDALKYLKGDLGERLTLRLPGGEAGGVINVLPGAPVLRQGELVVLFVTARGPAIPTTLGLGQGVFRVVRDSRSGAAVISPPPLKASDSGRVLRGTPERRLLTLEQFDATVRAMAGER